MLESLGTISGAIVEVALDGIAQQQRSLANNIANANSVDFKPQYVDFEAALQTTTKGQGGVEAFKAELKQLQSAINNGELAKTTGKQRVELDMEMVRMNEAVLKYQALIQGLSKYSSLTRMAISEDGKR